MQFPTDFGWWRHMQDTLNLCKSGYDPRKNSQVRFGLGHLQVSFYADNRSCAPSRAMTGSAKLPTCGKGTAPVGDPSGERTCFSEASAPLERAADQPNSHGWQDEDGETLQIARVRTAPEASSLHQDGDGPNSFVPAQRSRFNLRDAAAGLFKTRRTFTE